MTVEQKVERMQKSLDLSAAQAQQLKEILSNKPDWKQSHDQMAQQHRQLKQVLTSPNSTKEEALRLQGQISAEHQRLEQQHIEKMYEIRSVLTQEQRQKFAEQMEKRMEKRHARMQKWESRADKTSQQ